MNRKESGLMLVLALVAGLVGGAVSGRFIASDPVNAQETSQRARIFEAEEFRVVDKDNTVRAVLGTNPEGTGLALIGKGSQAAAGFALGPDGSAEMQIIGKDGKSSVQLKVADGITSLIFKDSNSRTRAVMGLDSDGRPLVMLGNQNSQTRASLTVHHDGTPSFVLGENKKAALTFAVPPSGAAISLYDKDGKTTWGVP